MIIVENEQIPEKEGYEIKIFICSKCKEIESCEAEQYKIKGWCYTMYPKDF